MGKNSLVFRLQAFVLGAVVMGLAGALYAHFVRFISPEAFNPLFATFLVWVMLIAGGGGIIAAPCWGLRDLGGVVGNGDHGDAAAGRPVTRAGALRVLLIGVLLQVILLVRPQECSQNAPAAGAAGRIALLLNCLGMSHAAPLQIAVESCGHHSNKRTPCRQNH